MTAEFLLLRLLAISRFAAALALCVWALNARSDVLVVLSDEAASYQEVAAELRAGLKMLRDGNLKVEAITADRLPDKDDQSLKGYELVVTVGLSAARAVVVRENTLPTPPLTLCLLIPRQSFEALSPPRADGRARRLSAVFIDQPISRQLDLLRVALPGRNRIGAVLGPSSAGLANDLREGARERDLTLNAAEIAESSNVYGALLRVLPASNVLLALPDPIAFNASTVYGLMLTTYRAQVPVVGFSEGLVKAGALLGLYSTATQLGKQGAEIASQILSGATGLPAPQNPRYFTVRANHTVARTLGISLQDEASLAATLSRHADAKREATRPNSAAESAPSGRAP